MNNDPKTHHDLEQAFSRLTPRGIGKALRPRVLAAMNEELQTEAGSPWFRKAAWGVAAMLLVGIAMNFWVHEASNRRLTQILGDMPILDQTNGLADSSEKGSGSSAIYTQYCATIKQLSNNQWFLRDYTHETIRENRRVDGARSGRAGGDQSGCQRAVYLDYRNTA